MNMEGLQYPMPLINPSHLYGATRNSLVGLRTAWQGEQAFRHEGLVLPILAAVLGFTSSTFDEWLLVLSAWLLVMVVELLNSAIEKACDSITLEQHPGIKAAKDMASAAIFITMVMNAVLWVRIFIL